MSARLQSLEFVPRPGGWTSGLLKFGSFLTFASGENGAGKTPVMKGIAYALGHPLKLTDEVKTLCSAIRLTLDVDNRPLHIERTTADEDRDFFVRIQDGAETEEFRGEGNFTERLLQLLEIPPRTLVSKGANADLTKAYTSVLAPLFWLDQDRGWLVPYHPMHNKDFIRNQGEEAVRWVLGVMTRNPVVDKTEQKQLETELATVDSLIKVRQGTITELKTDLVDESLADLQEAKRRVLEQLRVGRSSLRTATRTTESLSDQMERGAAALEHGRRRRAALTAERRKLALAVREIEADQEVLLANESAADLFRAVCRNESCQFFRQPAASYGRRLLFVKDQHKDLLAAMRLLDTEIGQADHTVIELESSLKGLADQRTRADEASGADQLAAEVEALAQQLQTITLQIVKLEQIAEEERRLSRLITRRHSYLDALDQLTGTRRTVDDRTRAVRQAFQESVVKWLHVLKTPNLGEVGVNDNFEVAIKGRRFEYESSESGSTRTRFVLAYHAALLETSRTTGGHHPPWLICDAPKQQEIHPDALLSWLDALRRLAKERPFQLVLSGRDVFAKLDSATDVHWTPHFQTNQPFPQYLGPATPQAAPES